MGRGGGQDRAGAGAEAVISLEEARARDAADPLRTFRDRFALPKGIIYLDGNSLGALPKAAIQRQREAVEAEWGTQPVRHPLTS